MRLLCSMYGITVGMFRFICCEGRNYEQVQVWIQVAAMVRIALDVVHCNIREV